MKKIEYASFINPKSFLFDIEANDLDFRSSNPEMDKIPSWRDYPSKKYDYEDESGKTIRNKNKKESFNNIALYILFVYDKGSAFHKQFREVGKKKEVALLESGLEGDFALQVSANENDEVLKMAVDFLSFQNDKLFTEIIVYESLFSEYTGLLLKQISESRDKDLVMAMNGKSKVREEFSSIRAQLDKLYLEFYGGDKDLLDKTQKILKFRPENIAKSLK